MMLTGIETGEIAIAKTIEAIFATLFQTISQPFQPALIRSYAKINTTNDYASQIAEKQETIASLNTEIASIQKAIEEQKKW